MKRSQRRLAIILITLVALLIAMSACDLSGIGDTLKTDISRCDVSFSATEYEYTGQAIMPDVTVTYVNRVLERDTDYSIEYADNINIGKGKVTITGLGNFKGQVTKEFDIVEELGAQDPSLPSGDPSQEPDEKYFTYTFSADGAQLESGQLIQRLESIEEFVLPEVSKLGYDFAGWTYGGKPFDFEEDLLPQQDATFVAQFNIITYTIEYNVGEGENSPLNKDEYTVESTFVLQDATRVDKKFVGWYLDDNFGEKLTTLNGVARNLVLYAKYVDFDYKMTLSYVVPNDVANEYTQETLYPGTVLTRLDEVISADGSKELVWYIDEDMTIRHNLRYMPDADLTLYARWEDRLYAGFLDKGWYKLSDIKSIDSYEDLLAYVEFVCYYNITTHTQKKITYVSGSDNIKIELNKATKESTFPRIINLQFLCYDNTCSVCMVSSVSGQATLTATDKEDYYPQIGNVFNNYVSNRRASFDDFAINYVDKTYECETSDQLFYVLSHGYRPMPVSGSVAYRTYNKFKEIMRSICDDRMSDLQKAKAIYDWLVINVYYDNNVADTQLPQSPYKYNAFYLEGVLGGSAVCDGLSKAYSVMCAIEGIDCVRVTGRLKDAKPEDAGHAWNKIQLMGEWFLSDSTWGNQVVKVKENENDIGQYYEYLKEQYFLFTDEFRDLVDNYYSDEYNFYVADVEYNYYSNTKMQLEIKGGNFLRPTTYTRTFDLYIDGDSSQNMSAKDELSYVFEYIDKNVANLDGTAFCIMLGEGISYGDIYDACQSYVNRVGNNARIKKYSIINGPDDIIDDATMTYRKDAILTIVLSLPA